MITQHTLEKIVQESRNRLHLIADSMPVLIAYIDNNQRYVFCNAAYHEWFGVSVKEIQGVRISEIFDDHSYRIMQPYIESALGGRRVHFEIQLNHRKLGPRINHTTLIPHIDSDRKTVGFCVLFVDITDLKTAEALEEEKARILTKALEKVRKSNRELEQFASVCSHDLHQPLRAVKGFTELLKKHYGNSLNEKGRMYCEQILDGTTRMQLMIDSLLDYARLETPDARRKTVNMETVVKQAIDNLGQVVSANKATITYQSLPVVEGDEMQLIRLIQNLLDNAIKYRRDIAPEIRIDAVRHEEGWLFGVRDNGIGIAAEYADRIYDIFGRLHSAKQYPGTGIGLSVCRKIVDNHGGRLWHESKQEEGSTFYFILPDKHHNKHSSWID